MSSLLRRPFRRLFFLALETFAVRWAYQNRQKMVTRFRRNDSNVTDTSRPAGDRFVGPTADREPSRFEEAKAAEAPPLTPSVASHAEEAISHVRIDAAS